MPVGQLWVIAAFISLIGCTATVPNASEAEPFSPLKQLQQLLPADAILLGEQHDAPDHQRLHRVVVEILAGQQKLTALALEMASQGQSTDRLGPDASEVAVQAALQWNSAGWSWAAYGPIIMAAVRAGVPVLGANLPPAGLRAAMANPDLEKLLSGPALTTQQQRIREGHCDLLPENQILPMTRVQIARDISMAQTLVKAAQAGKTVVLLAGGSHVDRSLGVPLYLPAHFKAKVVLMQTDQAQDATKNVATADQVWPARPAPETDYCAKLKAQRATPAVPPTPAKSL